MLPQHFTALSDATFHCFLVALSSGRKEADLETPNTLLIARFVDLYTFYPKERSHFVPYYFL
jgi:hypothetical protein